MSVDKRPAFEPPAVLAAPVTPPPSMRRPVATAMGSLLVGLRVVAGIVWLLALALDWDSILERDLGIGIDDVEERAASGAALTVVLVAGGVVLAIDLALGVLVYFGNNGARLAVMIFATLSITIAAIDYFTDGADITVRTTLITLSLDILVLLALSSRAARAYARRPRPARRRRRRVS
jgi:hypothetical protein